MSRPNLSYLKNIILAIVGIPCGVLAAVTGLSPAPALQPAIRWLLGLNGSLLNGVVLFMLSFTSWSGLLSYAQTGNVQWANGLVITFGTFIGAAAAGRLIQRAPLFFVRARPFWAFLPLAAALTMISRATGLIAGEVAGASLLPTDGIFLPLAWSLMIGAIAGLVGFAGDLGSMLVVPSLFLALGRTIWQAQGTAIFILVLASLPAALVHVLRRTINMNAAIALSVGGIFGALFGSHLAVKDLQQTALTFVTGCALCIYSLISLFKPPIQEEPLKPGDDV